MELRKIETSEVNMAMSIIDDAKKYLKEQGIDQWQTGYPDHACIKKDALNQTGYFIMDGGNILGYVCVDFDGEQAYDSLNGEWASGEKYVVIHRMAFAKNARGKNLSNTVFELVENMSRQREVYYFRADTDAGNLRMQHILKKNGFTFRGTIWFDNSEKIAFDKVL